LGCGCGTARRAYLGGDPLEGPCAIHGGGVPVCWQEKEIGN